MRASCFCFSACPSCLLLFLYVKRQKQAVDYTRSITMAIPCPTPMHIVHSA
jgi:hypothetical protein